MKRFITLLIVAITATLSYGLKKAVPIEGTWQMVHAQYYHLDSLMSQFSAKDGDFQWKTFCKGYFMAVYQSINNNKPGNSGVCGKYVLKGNNLEETLDSHFPDAIKYFGKKPLYNVQIKGDSLIQTGPYNEDGRAILFHFIEKYVRVK
ncbi:hypothetical protein [Parabacteroides sp. FAFU027]|uniref:hypothetical protein n=1 Tax=Parabacteroides sp. FAFU027 TaxID=2922715 RepID=UPI001FAFF28B|nr:hypothetical protein [Parabacteroides sp. FAFU027]